MTAFAHLSHIKAYFELDTVFRLKDIDSFALRIDEELIRELLENPT